jgi:coenzyme F420-reducing hydrogenase alpha subunit
MSASLEGRIDVTLARRGKAAVEARIVSSRPQVAQRLMAGRTPAEAADLAGMIFTLCGRAQRIAAEAACAAAMAETASAGIDLSRQRKILAEMAQEHAWRLLLDWPSRQGVAADPALMLALRRVGDTPEALADVLEGLLAGPLLGEPASEWLMRCAAPESLAGFDAWAGSGVSLAASLFDALGQGDDIGVSRVAWLPAVDQLSPDDIHDLASRALASQAFCACPERQGRAAETGALARCQTQAPVAAWLARRGRGVGARMLARLLELVQMPERLRQPQGAILGTWTLPDQVGVAGVETSRGLLLHIVHLDGGKVAQYRIIAPTEWNFHPAGPLAEALADLPADTRLEARARQVALSLDPCVEYGITLEQS